ncbi:CTP synthase, partial [Rossellomorea marisflavi]
MPMTQDMKDKIALFCDIDKHAVIEAIDADTLYSIPLSLQDQKLDELTCQHLKLDCHVPDMTEWTELVERVRNLSRKTTIALVGKYVEL